MKINDFEINSISIPLDRMATMKNILRIAAIMGVVIAIGATDGLCQTPKMKMTTPIPEGIATPDKLETHLGTLTSFDGVPDKETTQKVYDDLDLRRATEASLSFWFCSFRSLSVKCALCFA